MKLKLTLATATALGLLMGGAYAGDNNKTVVVQGNTGGAGGHSALIQQNGDRNQAGETIRPVRQIANGASPAENFITLLQQGDDNKAGIAGGGNGFLQNGVDNQADVSQHTSRNRANTLYQQNVGGFIAGGTANKLVINQGSAGDVASVQSDNFISRVMQIKTQHVGGGNSVDIFQEGGANAANIVGDTISTNTTVNSGAAGNGIYQNGVENTAEIDQFGSANEIVDLRQGGNQSGMDLLHVGNGRGNDADVLQNGVGNIINALIQRNFVNNPTGGNAASVTQTGNGNVLVRLEQNSSDSAAPNSATLSFVGSDNGSAAFGAGRAGSVGIAQAQAWQSGGIDPLGNYSTAGGGGNMLSYNVTGGNNSFGFVQTGNDNWINGVATGNNHQVAVSQVGDGNVTDFLQTGAGNDAGVDIGGNANMLNVRQEQAGASGNLMTVSITGDNNNNFAVTGLALSGAADAARDLGAPSLDQGDLFQNGSNNQLTVTVLASNANAFATYQDGSNNQIEHTISTGDGNQAVIAQNGIGNQSVTTQTGGGNNLGVSQ